MLGVLAAAVVVPLLVVLGVVLLCAVTVAPFVLACDMAERRGFSPARWGAVSLVASAIGLSIAWIGWRSDEVPGLLAVVPLGLTWTSPGLLWLLEGTERTIGGRLGAHS